VKLDENKFKIFDVNPMMQKACYKDCPQKGKACFHIAMGAPFELCEYLDSLAGECNFDKGTKEP